MRFGGGINTGRGFYQLIGHCPWFEFGLRGFIEKRKPHSEKRQKENDNNRSCSYESAFSGHLFIPIEMVYFIWR